VRLPGGKLVAPIHQVFHAHSQRGRHAREVGGDLPGTAGFPLRHGAARYADCVRQLILGPVLLFASGADAGADVPGIGHPPMLREFA